MKTQNIDLMTAEIDAHRAAAVRAAGAAARVGAGAKETRRQRDAILRLIREA